MIFPYSPTVSPLEFIKNVPFMSHFWIPIYHCIPIKSKQNTIIHGFADGFPILFLLDPIKSHSIPVTSQ